MRPASFRLNVRVFSVFLIVGLLMLAAASYLVIGIGQAGLRNAWGQHLQQVADQTAAAVDTYVFRLVIDASVLSRVPEVRDLAASTSQGPPERQTTSQPASLGAGRESPGNRVSRFLAEVTRQNPIYRSLLLTNREGRVVAASGPVGPDGVAGEAWWKDAVGDGTGGHLVVSDVRYDPRAGSWGMEIAAPVEAPNEGHVAGVLKALIDMREIGAVLGGVRMGSTGDAALVRADGSFVFAQGRVDPNAQFFATNLLRERLAAARAGEPQVRLHFGASTADGTPRLVGVAMSQLKASFPHLAWVIAVSQAEEELFSAVRTQLTSLIIVLGLTAIAVVLFAFWYSVRLAAPPEPEEMDLHLVRHPRVHRIEEPEETEPQVSETV
jgi:hypothetical protein